MDLATDLVQGVLAGGYRDLYRTVIETSSDLIVMTDSEGRIAFVNRAAEDVLGYTPEEMRGHHFSEFVTLEARGEAEALFEKRGRGKRATGQQIRGLRIDGSSVDLSCNATPLTDAEGNFQGSVAVITELTRPDDQERELAQLVRDNEMILRSAGDGIIRLDAQSRITYANPAAGEIVGCSHAELMGRDAHELLHHSHSDGSPYPIEDCPIHASLQGEVSHRSDEVFWRPDGRPFPVKYTSAPIREGGRVVGAVCVFADNTDQRRREDEMREELEWEQTITRAVEHGGLIAHSQPIIDLRSGESVQEELLVRMQGQRGTTDIVPPSEFLPAAERLDLIQSIDRWMLAKALELVHRGRTIEVNISARSLSEPCLLKDIEHALREPGMDPTRLILELTETSAAQNLAAARRFVQRLERLGCRLALDDFGTGFGAMTYLKTVPAHFLKIDIEFVRELPSDPASQRVVKTIVDIARLNGQRTIAEGVESNRAAELLGAYGVDYAQGYLYGRPVPLV